MPDPENKPLERDWRPVPDPTLLTTAAVQTAINALEEKMLARLEGMRGAITARLDASDQATRLQEATVTRVPTLLDKELAHHRNLTSEQFERVQVQFQSIQNQFTERDVRTETTSKDSKVAVDAALQAAKEAVAEQNRSSALAISKSEAATDKRIDQIIAMITTSTSASDGKIDDIKERITRLEGQSLGSGDTERQQHANSSLLVAIVAAIFTFIGIAIAAAALMRSFLPAH